MTIRGYKHSKETKLKISIARIGKHHSKETKRKMGLAHKGKHHSEATKKKMSIAMKGRKYSEEHRRNHSLAKKGDRNPAWKGGVTTMIQRIRKSLEYRIWREKVFERDNYTCQDCGYEKGRILNAHHIKPFANYPNLRFKVDNGKTQCKPCHIDIHAVNR